MHPDSWRYRGCLIFKSTMLAHFFLAVAWVRVCIVSGMLLCASSPRDMGDTTIVGYLVRLCHHV